MRSRLLTLLVALVGLSGSLSAAAQSGEWLTFSHDAQRSGWARDEGAFSTVNAPHLDLRWKTVLPNEPLALSGLTAALIARGVPTGTDARNLVIVAGRSNHLFVLDAEQGTLVWRYDYPQKSPPPGEPNWLCPMGLNATPVIDAAARRVFVVVADGSVVTLDLRDGRPLRPPTRLVLPFSKVWSLNYTGGVLYTSICAGLQSGPFRHRGYRSRYVRASRGAILFGRRDMGTRWSRSRL